MVNEQYRNPYGFINPIKDPKYFAGRHEVLNLKALILFKLSRLKESIECYDEVLGIDPDNDIALYNKACFLAELGDIKEALKCLEKAIKMNKRSVKLARQDESLQKLKNEKRFQELIESKNEL